MPEVPPDQASTKWTGTPDLHSAQQTYLQAAPGDHVIGWRLNAATRQALLSRFPARYANTVADHVTLRAKVAADAAVPPTTIGSIIGRSDDGQGVEAMVVQVEGGTGRPDGSTYHITWSLADDREAVESNEVIRKFGWQAVDPPAAVSLEGARFP